MPRRKRTQTIAADLQVITRQLAALTERVREAEAVKNAVDSVMKSTNSRPAATTGKRRGRPPGSKNKAKPANGRRRRRSATASTAAATASATRRRRPGRPRKNPVPTTMG